MISNSTARIGASALLALALLCGCGSDETAKKADLKTAPAGKAGPARNVTVATVAPRTLSGGVAASGVLVSREEAAVSSELSGFRVARVLADIGQYVRAGQTLVQLDDTLLRSQIDQQTALSAQAEVAAQQAEAQATRVAGLDGQGVLSQEQIEDRRFQARSARASANAQAAALRDLQTRRSRMTITAPVSGLVLERTVRPGDLSGGGQAMFRLARDGIVELRAEVAESAMLAARPGQPVQVTLPSGQSLQGVVRLIGPNVDPETKFGEVRVSLPTNPDLRPGGFARAVFSSVAPSARTVPESALRYDADGVSVMVLDVGNRVSKMRVRTGQRGDGYVELLEGPPAGSRVLLGAASFVLEGDVVNPVQTAAPAAPAAAAAPAAKTAR